MMMREQRIMRVQSCVNSLVWYFFILISGLFIRVTPIILEFGIYVHNILQFTDI